MENLKEELEKLMQYRSKQEIVYATGKASNGKRKKLVFTLDSSYRIYIDDVLITETTQPFVAIEFFKSLGESR